MNVRMYDIVYLFVNVHTSVRVCLCMCFIALHCIVLRGIDSLVSDIALDKNAITRFRLHI